ncbi:hypothetical protein AVEN_186733-1 [Araneus ventricosus]|uniref:Uncharacterized protein n=1 Tax=Araneus ventricosus TaxID=182803 RepID=A0A4Y2WA55_ARAVE|nr:hypothetical protein AVEN_191775-1 [Araneus ventricosus]GBO33397.1 hypothetical protein AVEN_192642-1 [Araneus ventricosus]GBO33408.1 hypothetical protein AVEN_129200-1 [Araneus ventricosus]GBO33411.1 hypothetical protein AVEN_186733-1 [Araneus ventricosus]
MTIEKWQLKNWIADSEALVTVALVKDSDSRFNIADSEETIGEEEDKSSANCQKKAQELSNFAMEIHPIEERRWQFLRH